MAIAATHRAALFQGAEHELWDQRIYCIASDGDLMEGISHEAASLAGHLGLGRLIGFFDDNRITIDGPTSLTCSDDVVRRFEEYGWQVLRVDGGNDLAALDAATHAAIAETARPSLVVVRTHIGYGSPNKQDTAEAHGAPLGPDEVRLTKAALGWPWTEPFHVPVEVRAAWLACRARGAALQRAWEAAYANYAHAHPESTHEFDRRRRGLLPAERPAPAGGPGLRRAVLLGPPAELRLHLGGAADVQPGFLASRGRRQALRASRAAGAQVASSPDAGVPMADITGDTHGEAPRDPGR